MDEFKKKNDDVEKKEPEPEYVNLFGREYNIFI
jgi:hypothetical protein